MTLFSLRRALCGAIATGLLTAAPAIAAPIIVAPATSATTHACADPVLSQPFSAFRDFSSYALAPGGDFSSVAGWTLTGGATLAQTAQHDGATGGVLDLPNGAQATSPPICITAIYPTARLWVNDIVTGSGVFFYVSYLHGGTWTAPKSTGQFHGQGGGWTLTNHMNVQPANTPGWQLVRFTFVATGKGSRYQVDDFWVDPRMRF